jgi:hypothetical protein
MNTKANEECEVTKNAFRKYAYSIGIPLSTLVNLSGQHDLARN